jgi:hypothetical protein
MIVRLLGLASVADAAWQLVDRKGWARFWGRSLIKLRKPTAKAKAIAAGELLLGTWLVLGAARRRGTGTAAKFRLAEDHPITAT